MTTSFTTMIIEFNYYYCCITSIQYGKSPLDLVRENHKIGFITQEIFEILKAHENKPEAQTK